MKIDFTAFVLISFALYFVIYLISLNYEFIFEWLKKYLFLARLIVFPVGFASLFIITIGLNLIFSWKTKEHISEIGSRNKIIDGKDTFYTVNIKTPESYYPAAGFDSKIVSKQICIHSEKVKLNEKLGLFGIWRMSKDCEFILSNKQFAYQTWIKSPSGDLWNTDYKIEGRSTDTLTVSDE